MAVTKQQGEETRPSPTVAETRVGDVNRDEESRHKADDLADGIDKDTKDRIVHDTTTRKRTVRAKRQHEPLDLDAAADKQPDEDGNGPRAAEVGGKEAKAAQDAGAKASVSEKQVKAGQEAAQAERVPSGGDSKSK